MRRQPAPTFGSAVVDSTLSGHRLEVTARIQKLTVALSSYASQLVIFIAYAARYTPSP
jgi:hypothetical protein